MGASSAAASKHSLLGMHLPPAPPVGIGVLRGATTATTATEAAAAAADAAGGYVASSPAAAVGGGYSAASAAYPVAGSRRPFTAFIQPAPSYSHHHN